jgi:DNA-binding winged helix-turn-helix (wHTH) protein/Tol biopolymer transport system component
LRDLSNSSENGSAGGKPPVTYEFIGFRLDSGRKCLWHSDELVSLTPKAVEILLVLVQNSGEIVDKAVLLDAVWADTFVEESTLSQNILTLRKALATFESGKKFITTVPRRGYRFVAPVVRKNGSNGSNGSYAANFADPISDFALPVERPGSTVVNQVKRSNRLIWAGAAMATLIVAAFVAVLYFGRSDPMVEARFREFRTTNLLSDANIRAATISPDGAYVAVVERRGNTERVLVRQIAEANPLEVVPGSEARLIGVTFSPDSQYIFYSAYRQTDTARHGELFRVPVLGGLRQLVVNNIDSPVSVSRSGQLAFVRRRPKDGDTQLIVTNGDGSNEHVIAERKDDEAFSNASISPDGSMIVCAVRAKDRLESPMQLVVVETASGRQRSMTTQPWLWIGQSVWLGDGSGVAVVAYGSKSPTLTDEVWFVPASDGSARLLESGVNGVFGISLTSDGNSLVTVKSEKITSFVVSPLNDLSAGTNVVTKTGDVSLLRLGADWTADERILYATTSNGSADVWSVRADGTDAKQMTLDRTADLMPRMSVDGRHIYFLSNRSGLMSVWRTNSDGSGAEKITDGKDVFSLDVALDGEWIYYTARADSVFSQHLWKARTDGSDVVQITTQTTIAPRISPDGRSIACLFPQPAPGGGGPVLTLLKAENGEILRQFPERKNDSLIEWSRDGQSLIIVSRLGVGSTLWRLPTEGGEAVRIKEWPDEAVFRIAVSPAGDRLFYEKGVSVNNVIWLRDVAVTK